jgi:hypothetical protein
MIEILKYKAIDKNFLMGFVDVKFSSEYGSMYVKDISLFKKGEERWLSFPSQVYEKEGKKKYKQYLGFESADHMQKFQRELFEKLEKSPTFRPAEAIPNISFTQSELPF